MNVRTHAISLLFLTSFATAQSEVLIGQDAIGCTASVATLPNGSPVAASVTFDYDPKLFQLRVVVRNLSPVEAGVASPVITRVYFNVPKGMVTRAQLVDQFASGATQPAFKFGFDADASDGNDPNQADCLGTFNFRLAASDLRGGIASDEAVQVCADAKSGPVRTTTFLFHLVGQDVHNLRSDTFAASPSRNSQNKVNVAVKFDGAGCEASGTFGNGDVCRTAVFLRGHPMLGQTVMFAVVGGSQCRAFLGISETPGPADLKKFTLPIGLPVLFTYDLGFLPPADPEAGLPVFIPFAPELIGYTFYMTSLTHPYMMFEGPYGFADAYVVTISGTGLKGTGLK